MIRSASTISDDTGLATSAMRRILEEEDNNDGASDSVVIVPYIVGSELTTGQHALVTAILVAVSSLSILCSIRIIQFSRWHFSQREDGMYYRLMAGLSASDALFSLMVFLTPFLIVSDAVSWNWAIGNTASCSLIGFFLTNFGLTTTFYNCLLSLSFLAKVRFQWTPQLMLQLERIGTVLIWILPLFSRITSVATGTINPGPLSRTCTDNAYPIGCGAYDACERGEHYALHRIIFQAQVVVAGAVAIVATVLVYCYCRRQLKNNRRYDVHENLSRQRDDLLRKIASRAVFYSLAFLNTLAWPLVLATISGSYVSQLTPEDFTDEGKPPPMPIGIFLLNIFANFFYPLQGFINYMIYTRHDIRELREKKYPTESYLQVFIRVWKGETIKQHQRASFSRITSDPRAGSSSKIGDNNTGSSTRPSTLNSGAFVNENETTTRNDRLGEEEETNPIGGHNVKAISNCEVKHVPPSKRISVVGMAGLENLQVAGKNYPSSSSAADSS